jgi:ABC-type multidrug transport system fused ATPase/permease subunit
MQIFKKFFLILSPYERKSACILLIIILITALIDMIGVASILPFTAVLSNPNVVEKNHILNSIFQFSKIFGVEDKQEFIFFLGFVFLILLLFSLAFRIFTIYATVRFSEMRHYSISKKLLQIYLGQPYSWFLNQNSSNLEKTILSEVQFIVRDGISQSLDLIARGSLTIVLMIMLFIVDLKLTLLVGLAIVLAYGIVFYSVSGYLKKIGGKRLLNNELRFRTISQAFNAIKEVKVGGLEHNYIRSFSDSSIIFAKTTTSAEVIKQLPRFFLEAIVFGGILLILLYKMDRTGSFVESLPVISLYIFTGYRLMPALQNIYASLTMIKFIETSFNKLYEEIKNLKLSTEGQDQEVLPFNKVITLKNIHYSYPNSSRKVLKDINLSIPAKSVVGIVGSTGSGKTTIVDIILGLLEPQIGNLEVDGKVIVKKNLRSWQQSIGYVPQKIYLLDDTVAANIAFGVQKKNINQKALEKSSNLANLHNFVMEELPYQYQTLIGDNGVRLSGGQRQRIGIARALYHNPQLLILDEATSALDIQVEKNVMDALNKLYKEITIIIIAHRLNTVKNCDIIFKLNNGEIVSKGKFSEIFNQNA